MPPPPLHLQTQLADPGVGAGLQIRELPLLERFQRPPGGFQRAVQVAHVLEEVADDAVGGTGHQRLVAVAQLVQGRAILGCGAEHDRRGSDQGVRRGRGQPLQGDQRAHRAGPLDEERVDGAQRQRRPGGLEEVGPGPEMRQHPGVLLGQLLQALEVGLDDPQAPEHGRRGRDRAAVRLGEAVPERLGEVVLLGPDPLHRREGVGPEGRIVVRHPEVARPGQEPVDHLIGLAGRLPARRAELPHRLQHPEPRARGGCPTPGAGTGRPGAPGPGRRRRRRRRRAPAARRPR